MSSSTQPITETTQADKPLVHHKIQTDFGLMEFDSNSKRGYWWGRIMNGESMSDLAKPVVSKNVKEVINEVSIDAGSVRGNVFRFVRRMFRWMFRWNVPWR